MPNVGQEPVHAPGSAKYVVAVLLGESIIFSFHPMAATFFIQLFRCFSLFHSYETFFFKKTQVTKESEKFDTRIKVEENKSDSTKQVTVSS